MADKKENVKEEMQETIQFDCLAITAVHVHILPETPAMGKLKAMADVVVNDQLQLRGLKVVDGQNGLFVGYPNDPFYKGDDYKTIYQPIARQFREHLDNCVLEKYQEVLTTPATV